MSIAAGKAITFESAMADVAKVVDGTDEQMQRLTERTKELSRTIPLAADELAKIAAFGGQTGVPVDKLEEFVRLASQMSVAFGMTAEEAGRAMAYLSNAFGLPLESMRQLGDAINTLGNTTAATEASIVEVLSRVSGATKQFGLSAEQAAALGATMLSMGVSSQIAGTGINALLSKLQTANVQSADFQNALAQIGISAQQLAEDIQNNPQEALLNFLRTLEKVDQASRAEILSKLFGIEYQDDISRLLNGLDQYEQSLARVGDAAGTAGAMQKEFDARVKSTEAQIQLLQNALKEVAINFGSSLLPVIRLAASGTAGLTTIIGNLINSIPGLGGVLTAIVSAYGAVSGLRIAFFAARVAGTKMFADVKKLAIPAASAVQKACAAVDGFAASLANKLTPSLMRSNTEAGKLLGTVSRFPYAAHLAVVALAAMTAKPVAEAIAGLRIDSELDEIEAAAKRATNQRILRLQAEAHQWSQYRDVAKRSLEDVAQMDEFARDQYREQLEGAMRYYQAAARELAAQTQSADEEIKKAASQKLTEVQAQINSLKQGLREVQTIAEAGAETLAGAGKAKAQNL